jgi:hypothetical protein
VFSAGADVALFAGMDAAQLRPLIASFLDLGRRMDLLPFPTLAAVHGTAWRVVSSWRCFAIWSGRRSRSTETARRASSGCARHRPASMTQPWRLVAAATSALSDYSVENGHDYDLSNEPLAPWSTSSHANHAVRFRPRRGAAVFTESRRVGRTATALGIGEAPGLSAS